MNLQKKSCYIGSGAHTNEKKKQRNVLIKRTVQNRSHVLSTINGDFLLSTDHAQVLQKSCVTAKKLTILIQHSYIALQNCNSTLGYNSNSFRHNFNHNFSAILL